MLSSVAAAAGDEARRGAGLPPTGRGGGEEEEGEEGLSAYEKQRLANIARNEAFLREIGIAVAQGDAHAHAAENDTGGGAGAGEKAGGRRVLPTRKAKAKVAEVLTKQQEERKKKQTKRKGRKRTKAGKQRRKPATRPTRASVRQAEMQSRREMEEEEARRKWREAVASGRQRGGQRGRVAAGKARLAIRDIVDTVELERDRWPHEEEEEEEAEDVGDDEDEGDDSDSDSDSDEQTEGGDSVSSSDDDAEKEGRKRRRQDFIETVVSSSASSSSSSSSTGDREVIAADNTRAMRVDLPKVLAEVGVDWEKDVSNPPGAAATEDDDHDDDDDVAVDDDEDEDKDEPDSATPSGPPYGFGKADVVAWAAEAGGAAWPRFNKYAGVCEWQNCCMLWVNIGRPDNAYSNQFLEDGRKMTWFAGARMKPDSRPVQRLCSDTETVLLFCRFPDEPYICLGRLRRESVDLNAYPIHFVWRLEDFDRLKDHRGFSTMVATAS